MRIRIRLRRILFWGAFLLLACSGASNAVLMALKQGEDRPTEHFRCGGGVGERDLARRHTLLQKAP